MCSRMTLFEGSGTECDFTEAFFLGGWVLLIVDECQQMLVLHVSLVTQLFYITYQA